MIQMVGTRCRVDNTVRGYMMDDLNNSSRVGQYGSGTGVGSIETRNVCVGEADRSMSPQTARAVVDRTTLTR